MVSALATGFGVLGEGKKFLPIFPIGMAVPASKTLTVAVSAGQVAVHFASQEEGKEAKACGKAGFKAAEGESSLALEFAVSATGKITVCGGGKTVTV